MNSTAIILYALMIVNQSPDVASDQMVAIFSSKESCAREAAKIIEQGPSAYCVVSTPKSEPPKEDIKLLTTFIGNHWSQ